MDTTTPTTNQPATSLEATMTTSTYTEKRNDAINAATKKIARLERDLAEWAEALIEDPRHQLEWAQGAFTTGCKLTVAREALAWLSEDDPRIEDPEEAAAASIETLQDRAQKEALRGARFPSFSTSPTSNLTSTLMASEWAELAEDLGFLI